MLVEHLSVLDLGFYIGANFSLAVFRCLSFVSLVLAKHFLEVFLFLTTLLLLKLTLHFHFFLKTVHKVNFCPEGFLVLVALPQLFFAELAISTILFLLDFLILGSDLILFTLAEKSYVLFLKGLVHAALIHLTFLTLLLLLHLLVEFLSNQSTALLLAKHCLLLLFVVEQSVKLLDGSPLIFLG